MDSILLVLRFKDSETIKKTINLKELGLDCNLDREEFFEKYGFFKDDQNSLENYIHELLEDNSPYEVAWRFNDGIS